MARFYVILNMVIEMEKIHVIGAGLAGSEAAYFLANLGYEVKLYEMRPKIMTPAHHTPYFGELVCSNSLKSNRLDNACGLLKEEMRHLHSLVMEVAKQYSVPSGQALSVDRDLFAQEITKRIRNHPHIEIIEEEVKEMPKGHVILASGPLSSAGIIEALQKITGSQNLSFFDACAPIIEKESIDFTKAYYKSRYEEGDNSYINCAMNSEEYRRFYDALIHAELAKTHDFDTQYFEGCMPIEVMAKRGEKTLRYGPLKPMGLRRTPEDRPFAVVQLRQDNVAANLYNMVGFQTNLTYAEQKRVFSLIPGLENARFVRYGLMHRNTFVCAPQCLTDELSLLRDASIYIAGQLSGVEGYVESAATGLLAAIYLDQKIRFGKVQKIPQETMLGSLVFYITHASSKGFSPMNANFGIMHHLLKDREEMANRSLKQLDEWWRQIYG